jgi:hypothetical protein
MTFIVSEDGIIFEKDLGKRTGRIAKTMEKYGVDRSWEMVPQKEENRRPPTKWRVGTITAVKPYRSSSSAPSDDSYLVYLKVENTSYVILYKPKYDTGDVLFAIGHQLSVLIEGDTLTHNDILGNSIKDPILSNSTVTPP